MLLGLFSGIVQKGEKRGSALGFPTINILLTDQSVSGVYAGKLRYKDKEYLAAIFADPKRELLEAYLFDFDEELYGEEVSMTLVKKIREVEVFTDDEKLKERMAKDVEETREYFS